MRVENGGWQMKQEFDKWWLQFKASVMCTACGQGLAYWIIIKRKSLNLQKKMARCLFEVIT